MSPSSGKITLRVSPRKAAALEARKFSCFEAHDEGRLAPGADRQAWVVAVDDDEREVTLEVLVGLDDGVGEIALVVSSIGVRNRLGVSLGTEGVTLRLEPFLGLAVVLHDPVGDDRQLPRPRTPSAGGRCPRPPRASPSRCGRDRSSSPGVRRRCLLQELEVADGADVLEAVVLEER